VRYDDASYLTRWQRGEGFPSIHDNLYALADKHLRGTPHRSFCDLCCSTALLGQRFLEGYPGSRVCGIEGLASSVDQARAVGVAYPILNRMVTPATLSEVALWWQTHRVDVLLARRCLPEIFAADRSWGPRFVASAVLSGVKVFVVQGRVPTSRATHPIPDIDAEIAVLGPGLRLVEKAGQCAVLVPVT